MVCLLSCHISPHPMQGVLVLTRYASEPENAAIATFAFQRGNGSVMLLVAAARTNIFVKAWRAGCRCRGGGSVRRGKQVHRPIKIRQRGHPSYPFDVVTEPLWRANPLTLAATFLFRPDKHLTVVPRGLGSLDHVCNFRYVSSASFSTSDHRRRHSAAGDDRTPATASPEFRFDLRCVHLVLNAYQERFGNIRCSSVASRRRRSSGLRLLPQQIHAYQHGRNATDHPAGRVAAGETKQ
jgi:hypothetical protein